MDAESIKDVLKKLDKTAEKVLLVTDKDRRLLGTISDGDIRRYLLKGKSLEKDIRSAYYRKPTFVRKGDYSIDSVVDSAGKMDFPGWFGDLEPEQWSEWGMIIPG